MSVRGPGVRGPAQELPPARGRSGYRVVAAAGWTASVGARSGLQRAEPKRPAPWVSDRREPQAAVPGGAKPWEQTAPALRSTSPRLPIPSFSKNRRRIPQFQVRIQRRSPINRQRQRPTEKQLSLMLAHFVAKSSSRPQTGWQTVFRFLLRSKPEHREMVG